MTTEAALLQSIEANLADPTPLLIFADWLEEQGADCVRLHPLHRPVEAVFPHRKVPRHQRRRRPRRRRELLLAAG
jgi:uncharacterized protein (TIGR02996 family)